MGSDPLRVFRAGVPAVMFALGLVLAFAIDSRGAHAAGYTLLGSAGLLVLSTVIFRAGLDSNADRDREEEARLFYDREGRWPYRGELDAQFGQTDGGNDPRG
jgi:hypothetical protein